MRRIVLSIVFGLLFPVLCVAAVGFAGSFLPQWPLFSVRIYGHAAPGLLLAPFMLPLYLDLVLIRNGLLPPMYGTMIYRLTALVLFDWFVYGALFYLLLGRLRRFKNGAACSETPPGPPSFAGN